MSLRTRIALTLAVIAAAVSAVAAYGALASTAAELRQEVDGFLSQRADDVARTLQRLDRGLPRGRVDQFPQDRIPFGRLDAVTQVIGPEAEEVYRVANQPVLPVDEGDARLAADGGEARFRSVDVDGEPYRVVTAPLAGGGAVQVGRSIAEDQDVIQGLRRRLLVLSIVATSVAALLGWLLTRRTTRPIERLRTAAHDVAATVDLTQPVPVAGDREVRSLAESFNTMLAALDTSRRQQQRLVIDASHELRTPLTSLRTNIELLQRADHLDPDDRRRLLDDVLLELEELTQLVAELVELATDRSTDEPVEDTTLAELAGPVVERARRRTGRDVELQVTEPAVVAVRPSQIERAVANLVDNAVKYSPQGSPVEVVVDGRRVDVRDHGPGIAPADRPFVFDRFYRSTGARAQPGSGLGLAIVRQVVERHGGTVHVDDGAEGGVTVGFELPPAGDGASPWGPPSGRAQAVLDAGRSGAAEGQGDSRSITQVPST